MGIHILAKKKPHLLTVGGTDKIGSVCINRAYHLTGVPETSWNFYIGGYQPAQNWLEDCERRTLTVVDVQRCQKIIVALTETDRILKQVDEIIVW